MSRLFRQLILIAIIFSSLLLSHSTHVQAQEPLTTYVTQPPGYSSIRIFDREGRFVGRILPEKRYWTPIDKIPPFLQNALVAVEDSRFYEHGGIDVRGIARALVKDVVKGRMAEGGSTITQQLIKNKYLSGEKSLDRKITEGFMAVEFEKNYTKKQILEMYFNEIYYGNGAWGIAQAARIYFDKYPEELTEGECAILAGVPKNPGRYNPLGDPAKVNTRRDVVLKRMVDLKMISEKVKKKLRSQQVKYAMQSQTPQYLALVKSRLAERFGKDFVEIGGLDIATAMDLKLQKLAEEAVRAGTRKISPELQGALLSLDTSSGDILAFVGSVDFSKSAYNRAMTARRQPGSSIKPLIYAAAIDKGITAASLWNDAPVTYSSGSGAGWTPLNYGGEQLGSITLRQALAHSNNVITVKLLENIGIPYFTEFAGKAGLVLKNANDLSLALGTEEETLQEMVQAYTPFANGGLKAEARAIIRVFDRNRQTTTLEYPSVVTPTISPETAFVTTAMLKDVMTYGTAKSLKKFSALYPSAGKTGTTNDYRDAWFIGYTPQVVTGVWVGYDKPKPGGRGFTGGAVAAPIWEKFMRGVVSARPVGDFIQPEGVLKLTIDPANGYLANSECPKKVEEFFIAGTEPEKSCDKHGGVPLNPDLEEITLPEELLAPTPVEIKP
ncbi:MAG: PBP1A family penicillin-binding protein [Geobacteraceae bacterium]|nr:PBP1A family penicillin-binding protein [Geobacteraceae bacterium]